MLRCIPDRLYLWGITGWLVLCCSRQTVQIIVGDEVSNTPH